MFSQSLKFSYLVYEYTTNNKAFTEKYCKNIDKPALKCNGKCHLKSELAKASEENIPASQESKSNLTVELLFLETIPEFKFNRIYVEKQQVSISYSRLYFRLHSTRIFHPPTV